MSEPSSAEQPWPVRTVSRKIADWISRLGSVWVEGQLTQISARPGNGTAFLTLRDPAAEVSITVTCPVAVFREHEPPLAEGARVVVHAKPVFYVGRGTLSLRADEIRSVGIGELLARIERLRRLLAAEGLFARERKRNPPFLPRGVGLITGRASAAERDVLANASARWPAVRFRVVNVAVQGPSAVTQIVGALSMLDKDESIDVIVLARGGGSVEDLLPFSDETLCRAVADCRTPVLSAIGHEPDTPLVDHVADVRCSTPTDAGKRVVPDVAEETARTRQLRDRARRALHGWVDRERRLLDSLRSRPVLADPHSGLRREAETVQAWRERGRRAITAMLTTNENAVTAIKARLTSLGPAATLARGYAVVTHIGTGGNLRVVRSVADAHEGTRLRIRVADGAVEAVVDGDPEGMADGQTRTGSGGNGAERNA